MNVYGKRGLLIRVLYLIGAVFRYIMTLGGQLCRGNAVVLCYHGISIEQKERFRWQMSKIIDKTSVIEKCERRRSSQPLSRKTCITFDDAFANLLDNALPVIEKYHIPAIIFAVADNLGEKPCWEMPLGHPESNERTMTADQLVSLSKHSLIKIGSHTMTHLDLTAISCDQVKTELADSKQKLEILIGVPVEDLALPHGAYNQAVLAMAKQVGYKRIYTLDPRHANFESDNPVLGRFSMSPDAWKIEFILTCCGAYSWLFPFRRFIKWVGRIVKGVAQ